MNRSASEPISDSERLSRVETADRFSEAPEAAAEKVIKALRARTNWGKKVTARRDQREGKRGASVFSFRANASESARAPDREFLLSIYRLAVVYHQPLIEQQTGVRLGTIHVWDYSQLEQHQVDAYKESLGVVRRFLDLGATAAFRNALRRVNRKCAQSCAAAYYRNAIYVCFNSGTMHEELVAQCVVHELAHALWETLGGPLSGDRTRLSKKDRQKLQVLSEGYATFAQSVWFRGMYPLHARLDVGDPTWSSASVYSQGLRRIREIVNEHGPQILMKIPSRWREFA